MKKIRIILIAMLLIPCLSFAATKMVTAKKAITNLPSALTKLTLKSDAEITFPHKVPMTSKKKYYASAQTTKSGYVIYVDSTPECHGVHNCNIGSITSEKVGNPQIYYDMQNKEITIPVTLVSGHRGYYTPGHAMGDYWPPRLEWRRDNILYTISWQLDNKTAQDTLMYMANTTLPR